MTLFCYRLFFILISFNIKVILILHTKFQPNTLSCSGENADFIGFAIFSIGSHLEFSTRLNFAILKPWSLIMLHVKFEIHGRSGLRESVFNELNAGVGVNCGRKDEQTDGKPDTYIVPCFLAYRIRISACFTWTDNSYLTHVISPRTG